MSDVISSLTWQQRMEEKYKEITGKDATVIYQGTYRQIAGDYATNSMLNEIHRMLRELLMRLPPTKPPTSTKHLTWQEAEKWVEQAKALQRAEQTDRKETAPT